MMETRHLSRWVSAIVVGTLATGVYAQHMPRYRLGVGSALFYEVSTQHHVGETMITQQGTNILYVYDRDTNGQWSVALDGVMQQVDSTGSVTHISYNFSLFKVDANGAIVDGELPRESDTHHHCFIPLPLEPELVYSNWTTLNPDTGAAHTYRFHASSKPDDGQWYFTRQDRSVEDVLYGVMRSGAAFFNAEAGLVERTESQFQRRVGTNLVQGATVAQLRRADILLQFELKKLIRDGRAFEKVHAEYQAAMDGVLSGKAEPVDALYDAVQLLRGAAANMTFPGARDAMAREVGRHYDRRHATLELADRWRTSLGKTNLTWATETFDGKPYTSGRLAGKVTAICFWRGDRIASVRAWRRLEALAYDVADKKFAFLGANMDRNPDVAAAVVARIAPKQTTLKGVPLRKTFGGSDVPLLLLFDKTGALRDVRMGDQVMRRATLTSQIESLLRE
ncbi:MAG: hypothetical protein OSB41_01210 [Kiritimatiellae bacterium]|nr:hypothetical protein [Kiritimatiellia bacterium]